MLGVAGDQLIGASHSFKADCESQAVARSMAFEHCGIGEMEDVAKKLTGVHEFIDTKCHGRCAGSMGANRSIIEL